MIEVKQAPPESLDWTQEVLELLARMTAEDKRECLKYLDLLLDG